VPAFSKGLHEPMAIGAISIVSVTLGTALAYTASRLPRWQVTLEVVAGWLLIGGFGLLGYAIQCVVVQP